MKDIGGGGFIEQHKVYATFPPPRVDTLSQRLPTCLHLIRKEADEEESWFQVGTLCIYRSERLDRTPQFKRIRYRTRLLQGEPRGAYFNIIAAAGRVQQLILIIKFFVSCSVIWNFFFFYVGYVYLKYMC